MGKHIKIITKRIKINAKTKKAFAKKGSLSHYNANDSGNTRREKRSRRNISKTIVKKLIAMTT
jgi:ribosomal protein L35